MSNTAIQKSNNHEMQVVRAPADARVETTWYTPLVDVLQTPDAYIFQADLPGVKNDDLDLTFQDKTLTISAKVWPRRRSEDPFALREYGVGNFYRSFTIDAPVDPNGIKAELKNGELTVTVPKAEHAKARKIKIKGS